jgi:GcrA cell cycle regulator
MGGLLPIVAITRTIAAMRGKTWSGERLVLLRALWTAGATAQSIADELGGVSRCAVLGKIFRLRLGGGVVAPERRRSRRKDTVPLERPVPRRGKSLLELTNETCRWPHGRRGHFFFCGELGADLENGRPYCARHARRAFRAIKSPTTVPDEAAGGESRPVAAPAPVPQRYQWRAGVRRPAARWR